MALKNFTQFTPQTVLSATDFVVGYRELDEIRTDLDSLTVAISGLLISKGFTPGGGGLGSVRRVSYRYTIDAGENLNAVSGTDDFSRLLSYTPGQIEVYRNGSHLVETLDFTANNGTQVTNMSSFNTGDIIEVVALSATGFFVVQSLTGDGAIFQRDYRYSVGPSGSIANGALTINGPDDFGATLNYVSPNIAVYLNGSRLVNSYDYTATDGTSISLNEPVITGDIVDVQTLSSLGTGTIFGVSAYAGVSRIIAQDGVKTNKTIGTGIVTISADIEGRTVKTTPASNDQVMIFDVAGNTNKKTTVATLTSLAVATSTSNLIILQDQRPSGQNGGTFPSGSWLSRQLNTEVVDDGNNCTLAANLSGFTLDAGTYEIFAFAPAQDAGLHKARLQNITDGTTTIVGTSELGTFNYTTSKSFIIGKFTISSPKTFEIQHRAVTGAVATTGLGPAVGLGVNEIYTTVQLKKVL